MTALDGAAVVLAKIVPSNYLSKIGGSLNSSFGHGLADGIIDGSPAGVFKFAWDVTTDADVRQTLIEGVQALITDPIGVVQAIAVEKYASWKGVLQGNGTEQQKYSVGVDLGEIIGGLITGAGIKKVVNEIKGKTNVENLARTVATRVKSSQVLSWGSNAKGHLIKHADVLGFSNYTPQQLQKMLPDLKAAANQLYNNVDPSLTRVGFWPGQTEDVLMYITNNGKMLVTKVNGEFVTAIPKTSNVNYVKGKPYK